MTSEKRFNLDLREWSVAERLTAGVTLAAVTAGLILLSLVVFLLVPGLSGWLVPALLGIAILVVAYLGAVNFVGLDVVRTQAEAAADVPRLPVITLKCGECGTVFDLEDPGYRPLYHACPGCGVQGVVEAEDETPLPEPLAPEPEDSPEPDAAATTVPPPPEPVEEEEEIPPPPPEEEEEAVFEPVTPPTPEPEPAPEREPEPEPEPEEDAPAPPTPRRKLRFKCKGCGEPNVVLDDGTRPLVHACVHCGRKLKLNVKD